ncbi:MAG: hypothetical protein IJ794_10785 [Lachnospiraceae bacterium]|nr:hypothetical protein [Lachnospiraceae bacterium]
MTKAYTQEEVKAEADEAAAVEKPLQEKGVSLSGAEYFDISLYKIVAGEEKKVTDTGSHAITITLEIPANIKNINSNVKRTFYLVRVHDGVPTVLAETAGDQISFETSQFSVYAIAYHDELNNKDDDDEDDSDNAGVTSTGASQTANYAFGFCLFFLISTLMFESGHTISRN